MISPDEKTQLLAALAEVQETLRQIRRLETDAHIKLDNLHSLLTNIPVMPLNLSVKGEGIIPHAAHLAANIYGLPAHLLYSKRRDNRTVLPRQLAMYLARQAGLPVVTISQHFGMDHTSVTYACLQVVERMAVNSSYRETVQGCLQKLKPSAPSAVSA